MQSLSVVIICKNEAGILGKTLQSLEGLSDDIIVYDNGSTDGTQQVAMLFNAKLHAGNFVGFGKTKNKAIALAKYDWILCLDADEAIDEELKRSLLQWQPQNDKTVYGIAFKNFFANKHIRFGEWGRDYHVRLFNRKQIKWDEEPVHENLVLPEGTDIKRVKGFILHRTMRDVIDFRKKMERYAGLGAEKYFRKGKKATWLKLYLSPFFTFVNYYFLRLGFLDGREGFIIARMTAWYTYMKYARLRELNRQSAMDNKQKTP